MQLLVAVSEQCTRPDINSSTSNWLTRCQETSVLQRLEFSMELFVQTDLSGLSILQHTRARKLALYASHILTFHIAFASIRSSAERLASERVLVAYSDSSMSMAITSGNVDVTLPELPGEQSPAHWAYRICFPSFLGSSSALTKGHRNEATQKILSNFSAKVLLLLQQLNYTLSHPNHLASLVDPVTTEERV
jgi:nuclear pore complex protein Nup188